MNAYRYRIGFNTLVAFTFVIAFTILIAGCAGSLPTDGETEPSLEPTPDNPAAEQTVGIPSFKEDIQPLFGGCTCHGYEPGRFEPNYRGALSVVVPGDPESSQMVQMMRKGHHTPNRLDEEELAIVIRWIEAGAPDN